MEFEKGESEGNLLLKGIEKELEMNFTHEIKRNKQIEQHTEVEQWIQERNTWNPNTIQNENVKGMYKYVQRNFKRTLECNSK